jgi:hypothetical protein
MWNSKAESSAEFAIEADLVSRRCGASALARTLSLKSLRDQMADLLAQRVLLSPRNAPNFLKQCRRKTNSDRLAFCCHPN